MKRLSPKKMRVIATSLQENLLDDGRPCLSSIRSAGYCAPSACAELPPRGAPRPRPPRPLPRPRPPVSARPCWWRPAGGGIATPPRPASEGCGTPRAAMFAGWNGSGWCPSPTPPMPPAWPKPPRFGAPPKPPLRMPSVCPSRCCCVGAWPSPAFCVGAFGARPVATAWNEVCGDTERGAAPRCMTCTCPFLRDHGCQSSSLQRYRPESYSRCASSATAVRGRMEAAGRQAMSRQNRRSAEVAMAELGILVAGCVVVLARRRLRRRGAGASSVLHVGQVQNRPARDGRATVVGAAEAKGEVRPARHSIGSGLTGCRDLCRP